MGWGRTPPVAYGDSPLWDGALGMAGKFPAKVQSARTRQRLPPRGSCQSRQALTEGVQPACAKQCLLPQRRAFAESGAANAVFRYDPSREKAILENPQIFQNCKIIIILPLLMCRAQRSTFQIVPPSCIYHIFIDNKPHFAVN